MHRRTPVTLVALITAGTMLGHGSPYGREVLDVPQVSWTAAPVEFGIDFDIKEHVERDSVLSAETDTATSDSTNWSESEEQTIKSEIARGLNLSASNTPLPRLDIKSNFDFNNSYADAESYKLVSTYTSALKYERTVSQVIKTSATADLDRSHGYIATGFTLRNDGLSAITVKDVHFSIHLGDQVIASRDAVMDSECYANSPVPDVDCSKDRGGGALLTRLLQPGQTFSQAIKLPDQSATEILNYLRSPDEPLLTVSYSLEQGGKTVSEQVSRAKALQRSIYIRLLERDGHDRQFYVSTDTGNGGKLSLLAALQILHLRPYLDPHQGFISQLDGVKSDCLPDELASVPEYQKSPEAGAWTVAESSDSSFSGSITEPAPAGTRFLVAFVTRSDAIQGLKKWQPVKPFFIGTRVPSTRYFLASLFSEPTSPSEVSPSTDVFGTVHRGDVVNLWIRGRHADWTTKHLFGASAAIAAPPDFPHGWDFRKFCEWANCEDYFPDGAFSDLPEPTSPSDLALSINLGYGPIPLENVVPNDRHWFSRLSNGFVQMRFVITSELLRGEDHAVLSLTPTPVSATFEKFGRTVTPPQPPPHTALTPDDRFNYSLAWEWAQAEPQTSNVKFPESRAFEVEGSLFALDPKLMRSNKIDAAR